MAPWIARCVAVVDDALASCGYFSLPIVTTSNLAHHVEVAVVDDDFETLTDRICAAEALKVERLRSTYDKAGPC